MKQVFEGSIERAKTYVLDRLKRMALGATDAAVFDIDETLILNLEGDKYQRNTPVWEVYNYLNAKGVALYFVTARRKSEASIEYARSQAGTFYARDDGLYMVNEEYNEDPSASDFKLACRQRIENKKDKRIVLNVGDNWSDLTTNVEQCKERWTSRKDSYVLEQVPCAVLSWKLPNVAYEVA
jgi:predicted secreted acid phosphatase